MLHNRNVLQTLWWDPLESAATRPLALVQENALYCYGVDFNKNVTEVFAGEGAIAATYDYSPYGQAASTGDLVQPVQWSAEMHDEDFALVYYNYRYYNPRDGRWINRDPIAEQGGVKFILLFNQLSSINRLFGKNCNRSRYSFNNHCCGSYSVCCNCSSCNLFIKQLL